MVVGLCAVLLLRCISHWQRAVARLSKHPSRVLSSPFFYALLVSVVVSLITFPRWGYSLLGVRALWETDRHAYRDRHTHTHTQQTRHTLDFLSDCVFSAAAEAGADAAVEPQRGEFG